MGIPRSLAAEAKAKQGGFTLVELLVVVSIIVALAAVSVVSVGKFAGKGQEGGQAAEGEAVQAAMDAMMADKGIDLVTKNDVTNLSNGVQDFTSLPAEGALAGYMRQASTSYWYCWDATGKVKQQTATGACA